MTMSVQCSCGARYRVPDSAAGKRVRCKKCGEKFSIPAVEAVPEPEDWSDLSELAQGEAIAPARPVPAAAATPQPASLASAGALPGAGAAAAVARARGYFVAVGQTLACPLRPRNLAAFIILWFILCLKIPLMFAGCLGFLGMLIVQGYYYAFCLNAMADAANGEQDLAQPSVSGAWVEDLLGPLAKFLLSWVVVRVPAVVYLAVAGETDFQVLISVLFLNSFEAVLAEDFTGSRALFLAFYLAGAFFWPIIILIIALGGPTGIFRIDLILKTIVRSFPAYLCTVVFTFAALAIPFVYALMSLAFMDLSLGLLMALPIMIFGLELYAMIVAMRVIGLYYYHFKDRFAWSWG